MKRSHGFRSHVVGGMVGLVVVVAALPAFTQPRGFGEPIDRWDSPIFNRSAVAVGSVTWVRPPTATLAGQLEAFGLLVTQVLYGKVAAGAQLSLAYSPRPLHRFGPGPDVDPDEYMPVVGDRIILALGPHYTKLVYQLGEAIEIAGWQCLGGRQFGDVDLPVSLKTFEGQEALESLPQMVQLARLGSKDIDAMAAKAREWLRDPTQPYLVRGTAIRYLARAVKNEVKYLSELLKGLEGTNRRIHALVFWNINTRRYMDQLPPDAIRTLTVAFDRYIDRHKGSPRFRSLVEHVRYLRVRVTGGQWPGDPPRPPHEKDFRDNSK